MELLLEDILTMNSFKKDHWDTMYVAQIVKKEVTFCKISIRFLEIVLIFVNSLINVILKTVKMEVLFGKLYSSFKSMLFMIAQNSVAIFVIKKNFSI